MIEEILKIIMYMPLVASSILLCEYIDRKL